MFDRLRVNRLTEEVKRVLYFLAKYFSNFFLSIIQLLHPLLILFVHKTRLMWSSGSASISLYFNLCLPLHCTTTIFLPLHRCSFVLLLLARDDE